MHTVAVLLEAMSGRAQDLKQALLSVVGPSKAEMTCLDYRLHQDGSNENIFLLYETWESKEKYALQFEKPYIKELGEKLETLLAGPYTVLMGTQIA